MTRSSDFNSIADQISNKSTATSAATATYERLRFRYVGDDDVISVSEFTPDTVTPLSPAEDDRPEDDESRQPSRMMTSLFFRFTLRFRFVDC